MCVCARACVCVRVSARARLTDLCNAELSRERCWRGSRSQRGQGGTVPKHTMSPPECEPFWPSGKALGWLTEGPRLDSARLSLLFKKVVVCGHSLVTLSLTINETLKWLSSLPILIHEAF